MQNATIRPVELECLEIGRRRAAWVLQLAVQEVGDALEDRRLLLARHDLDQRTQTPHAFVEMPPLEVQLGQLAQRLAVAGGDLEHLAVVGEGLRSVAELLVDECQLAEGGGALGRAEHGGVLHEDRLICLDGELPRFDPEERIRSFEEHRDVGRIDRHRAIDELERLVGLAELESAPRRLLVSRALLLGRRVVARAHRLGELGDVRPQRRPLASGGEDLGDAFFCVDVLGIELDDAAQAFAGSFQIGEPLAIKRCRLGQVANRFEAAWLRLARTA